jgi:hypothetical protein
MKNLMADLWNIMRDENLFRLNAKNDRIGAYTIDTCNTPDCGWETGILKDDGNWVIVEYYENEEAAAVGHSKWIQFCATEPTEVWSVQMATMEVL